MRNLCRRAFFPKRKMARFDFINRGEETIKKNYIPHQINASNKLPSCDVRNKDKVRTPPRIHE